LFAFQQTSSYVPSYHTNIYPKSQEQQLLAELEKYQVYLTMFNNKYYDIKDYNNNNNNNNNKNYSSNKKIAKTAGLK
jgi:hypothetical protein